MAMNDIEKNHVKSRKITLECLCQGFSFLFLSELDECDGVCVEFVIFVSDTLFWVLE